MSLHQRLLEPPTTEEGILISGETSNSVKVDHDSSEIVDEEPVAPLQILMLVVGIQEDVEPFVAIGKRLKENNHRVRLATHEDFKGLVIENGLEFHPLGGDPKVLAEYIVKNKGLIPSSPSAISIARKQVKAIILSLLSACENPDAGSTFKAEAIIANALAFGHTHVAKALDVPIHIFSTMPWTRTREFPHPLSRATNRGAYKLSYKVVDLVIWMGIRDVIKTLKKKLKIRSVPFFSCAQGSTSDVPYGYIWSPHLVPKPKDWGPHIDVVGFCYLNHASDYVAPPPLLEWLEAGGDKPIYFGFGSLPVREPEKMTQIIVEALETTGQRGIIDKECGLGNSADSNGFIFLLEKGCPHDWLFSKCKAVVHHGGAGTTAAGLKAACPTTIVPIVPVFGDQTFWGEKVYAKGVGPAPIPVSQFSLRKLIPAINFMLDLEVKERADQLAKLLQTEDGAKEAVDAFFKQLPEGVKTTR